MRLFLRRGLVIVVAGAVSLGSLVFSILGGASIVTLGQDLMPAGPPGTNVFPLLIGDIYWRCSFFGICLAATLSVVYCFWSPRPSSRRKTAAYLTFLAVLIPMSAVNWADNDYAIRRSLQAGLDGALVALGLATILELLRIRPTSSGMRALHSIIVFLLMLESVAIPGLFATVFLFNRQGVMSLAASKDLSPSWLTAIAAVVSATIAVMTFQKGQSPANDGQSHRPKLTL